MYFTELPNNRLKIIFNFVVTSNSNKSNAFEEIKSYRKRKKAQNSKFRLETSITFQK